LAKARFCTGGSVAIDFVAIADDVVAPAVEHMADQLQRAAVLLPLDMAGGTTEFTHKRNGFYPRGASLRSAAYL